MSRKYLSLYFFNLVTPSWITTRGILISPELKFLTVWKSVTHFPVHKRAVTNSMPLHSTHNPHLQYLFLDPLLESDWRSVVELFLETVNVFRSLAVYSEELRYWCLATLSSEVPTTGVTQGNLELHLPSNSNTNL